MKLGVNLLVKGTLLAHHPQCCCLPQKLHSSSISKEKLNLHIISELYPKGLFYQNFSELTWLKKPKEFLLICKIQHKRRTVLENDYDIALGLESNQYGILVYLAVKRCHEVFPTIIITMKVGWKVAVKKLSASPSFASPFLGLQVFLFAS